MAKQREKRKKVAKNRTSERIKLTVLACLARRTPDIGTKHLELE